MAFVIAIAVAVLVFGVRKEKRAVR